MQSQRQKDAELMAKALVELILVYKKDVDSLLSAYKIDSSNFSPQERLLYVERMIQTNPQFARQILDLIYQKGVKYKNFGDAIAGAISGAIGGVFSGITGLVDATSDSGKKVRETMAQAQLIAAQAQLEKARAEQIAAARKRQNLTAIVGVTVAGMVLSIGIFGYLKFRKK